ncbi:hypothetical protein [Sphingomonas montanisoli]|uniref:Uncharacterized protein n=1 Tax=Sphingomonas montanisoli TaxID=2606412 RepID=A0A5D9CD55_9SPHN|nr:hypothetical protein [Sphingomonas montanisoli]TZG29082.1 hypothetical protein FYJ91_02800 [Sphingomonas montanisoli]
MIYGDPGSIISLGLQPRSEGPFRLSVPDGLNLVRVGRVDRVQRRAATWRFDGDGGRFASEGDAFTAPIPLGVRNGTGPITGGLMTLRREAFLQTAPLGLSFDDDPAARGTPLRMRLSFAGVVPLDAGPPLLDIFAWGKGRFSLYASGERGRLSCNIEGKGGSNNFSSTIGRNGTTEQLLEVEWTDIVGTPGGTLAFFIDGKPAGGPFATNIKPHLPPEVEIETNASLGNTRDSAAIRVRRIGISFDHKVADPDYRAVAPGFLLSDADLAALAVDARRVTAPQPPRTIGFAGLDGQVTTIDVTIGPLVVPAGQAYKAVLVDWSSGQGAPHPNELVMTRIAAQNCQFEDALLGARQAPWIECLPRGPVPNIAGIDYRCEAIRCGDYVQFQFGYDWDAATMPANPFGDPTGKHSYMIPHTWLVQDAEGRTIATIARPDGGPLNGTDIPRMFEGPFDGRGCAKTDKTHRWYPHGTVRAGIIWRSADPPAHAQGDVRAMVPLYDQSVPFGSHCDFSVNGFDLRIFAGGSGNDGQANGFANCRVMSWEPSDYPSMQSEGGRTRDPYRASLYSSNSLAANAAVWLRYTPFNVQGRSPTTGPGGTRDDRQIIAEPVARYASDPAATRAHDGRPWRAIALDYLTGYASDPVHAFERGRNVPVFKGNPNRTVTLRNHYYGQGNMGLPASQAWYAQGGRLSDWQTGTSPLRVAVPYAGDAPDAPYFGGSQIDKSHAHQFPGWGSLLFRTPEFAFLGTRFWDQNRLYSNDILTIGQWSSRDGAWAFMHAALAWKTGSASSTRLYSRSEILAFVAADFERFHDEHYATTPGFAHPPTNILIDGRFDGLKAIYAAAALFGPVTADNGDRLIQLDFQLGYWLTALGAAEKMGFNDALRACGPKVRTVIDWLIAAHRRRVVGRINGAPHILHADATPYLTPLWTREMIMAAGGDVAQLPQDYAAMQAAFGASERWDVFTHEGREASRDGQAMDQLIAAPATLRYLLRQSGDDIDRAMATTAGWRREKIAAELRKGEDAGSGWFLYLQATNNPPTAAQS